MERLTITGIGGAVSERKGVTRDMLRVRLAAYEETGLEPEDVTDLMAAHGTAIGLLTDYRALGPHAYLRELVEAKREGRDERD